MGWDENRSSHYDIRAEGALPPSITNSENGSFRLFTLQCFLLWELVPNRNMCVFESFKGDCSAKFKKNGLFNI